MRTKRSLDFGILGGPVFLACCNGEVPFGENPNSSPAGRQWFKECCCTKNLLVAQKGDKKKREKDESFIIG
jgi:hypothetical protein